MHKNVGTVDRVFRLILGLGLIISALTGYFTPWGWIGVIALVTAAFNWCPLYTLFGIRTCPLSKEE